MIGVEEDTTAAIICNRLILVDVELDSILTTMSRCYFVELLEIELVKSNEEERMKVQAAKKSLFLMDGRRILRPESVLVD